MRGAYKMAMMMNKKKTSATDLLAIIQAPLPVVEYPSFHVLALMQLCSWNRAEQSRAESS